MAFFIPFSQLRYYHSVKTTSFKLWCSQLSKVWFYATKPVLFLIETYSLYDRQNASWCLHVYLRNFAFLCVEFFLDPLWGKSKNFLTFFTDWYYMDDPSYIMKKGGYYVVAKGLGSEANFLDSRLISISCQLCLAG